ncbi:MAG: BACON domain-containing protein [Bryobacteraceae bacterium]
MKSIGGRSALLLGLLGANLQAQTYPAAFQPAPMSRAPIRRTPPEVKRSRPVEMDAALFDLQAAAGFHTNRARMPVKLVELNLFDDVSYRARLDRAENAWDGKTIVWSGTLEQTRRGQVILAATGKIVSGTITTGEGAVYQIRHAAGALHWVEEVDFSKLPPEAEPVPVFTPEAAIRAPEATADDGSIIDVMVVYTPAARQAVGGTTQMNNLVSLAVAETNQGYANSGVIQRVRLVYSGEVNYTESGSFSTDLNRLTNPSDGFADEVHGLRDGVHADLVSLWVNTGDSCGIAWLMTTASNSFANRAFSVVRRDCATGFYTFGHEMGHNQGSVHDVANSGGPGVFPYSYGYQQQSQLPRFRTIMAYSCSGGVSCPRINFWSSPSNTYSGILTGVSTTNNMLSLNNTRDTAANWRQSSAANLSLNPTSAEFAAAGGTGAVTVTASTSWTATRSDTWITITSGSSGTGSGTVAYSVAANTSNASRTGILTIGGVPFTITQGGAVTCGVTAINAPQTVTGSWNTTDCTSPLRAGRFADRYSFSGTAGQQVAISLSSAADSFLYLIAPNGTVLAEDDDSGTGLNARIPGSGLFTLPTGGAYLIEATTFGAGETGAYTLQVDVQSSCSYSISPTLRAVDANLNNGAIAITTSPGCTWSASSNAGWISITSAGNGAGSGSVDYSAQANTSPSPRSGTITVAGQTFTLTQSGTSGVCVPSNISIGQSVSGALGPGDCASLYRGSGYFGDRYYLVGTAGQQIRIDLTSADFDAYLYLAAPNGIPVAEDDDSGGSTNARIPPAGTFTLPSSGVYVIEATGFYAGSTGAYSLQLTGGGCSYSLSASSHQAAVSGGSGSVSVTAANGCAWTATGGPAWVTITGGSSGSGNGTVHFTVAPNPGALSRSGTLQVAGAAFTVFQDGVPTPLRLVAVTPCRLADTRAGQGRTGLFGPPLLAGGTPREIPVPSGVCGIPATARAYSINITVVPRGPLSYLTVWPAGQAQPLVSTLNSFEGRVVANAAIVPAGANGSIQVFVTNSTDVIIDINGYFAP